MQRNRLNYRNIVCGLIQMTSILKNYMQKKQVNLNIGLEKSTDQRRKYDVSFQLFFTWIPNGTSLQTQLSFGIGGSFILGKAKGILMVNGVVFTFNLCIAFHIF